MRAIKNHIFICLIAIFVLNLYFIYYLWLMPLSQAYQVLPELPFNVFFITTNLTLLLICIITLKYKSFDDYLVKKKWSSGSRFAIEILLMFTIFFVVFGLIFVSYKTLMTRITAEDSLTALWTVVTSKYFASLTCYFILTSMLLYFISNLQRRALTLENFISQSIGKMLKPKLEQRGFMFIDLDDATSLAEQLGSRKYAMLLRDCFRLFNELVVFEGFEVYQYVGDEVVLSWDRELTKGDVKAVQLFVDFKAYLLENVNYFIKTYDTVPFFKCAIHSGEVVKSEVGKKTKHLVYHGDVLNTTSRMLGECHRLGTDIIISRKALLHLKEVERFFSLQLLRNMIFKGKSSGVDAYILSRREMTSNEPRFAKLWKPFLFERSMIKDYQLN